MPTTIRIDDVLRLFLRHRAKMMDVVIWTLGLAWLAILIWPRSYESEAKLYIGVGRESVALDPTATTSETLMLQKTQEEEVNSALEVMLSRRIAELAVDKIGAERILYGDQSKTNGRGSMGSRLATWAKGRVSGAIKFVLYGAGLRDNIGDRELAVRQVRNTLTIFAPKHSTVITVEARAKSPQLAQDLAQAVVDSYLEEHLKISQTDGSIGFFEEQAGLTERLLREKTTALRDYSQQHDIVSIDANRAILKGQLGAIERDLTSAHSDLHQCQAEIDDLTVKVAEVDREIVNDKRATADTTWSGMRQRVYELEIREKELSTKFQSSHPELQEVTKQLSEVRQILQQLASERVDATTTVNPALLRLEKEQSTARTRLAGLQSRIAELKRQRELVLAQVQRLLGHEIHLNDLHREIAVLESTLATHKTKLEEARVIGALQSKRISNVSIFQPPTYVERPASPNKRLMAAAAVFLAFVGAVGLAFLAEFQDSTLRSVGQIEQALEVPVVASIPQLIRTKSLTRFDDPDALRPLREQCRLLLSELTITRRPPNGKGREGTTLGVLSCDRGNGGSTVAAALAVAAGHDGNLRTILVDTDVQSRFASQAFALNGAPGLCELTASQAELSECVQRPRHFDVAILASSATPPPIPCPALDAAAAGQWLDRLRQQFDLIVVDLPPASEPQQMLMLASQLDMLLLVVESERTEQRTAEFIRAQLLRAKTRVVGVVLNKERYRTPRWLSRLSGKVTA